MIRDIVNSVTYYATDGDDDDYDYGIDMMARAPLFPPILGPAYGFFFTCTCCDECSALRKLRIVN